MVTGAHTRGCHTPGWSCHSPLHLTLAHAHTQENPQINVKRPTRTQPELYIINERIMLCEWRAFFLQYTIIL